MALTCCCAVLFVDVQRETIEQRLFAPPWTQYVSATRSAGGGRLVATEPQNLRSTSIRGVRRPRAGFGAVLGTGHERAADTDCVEQEIAYDALVPRGDFSERCSTVIGRRDRNHERCRHRQSPNLRRFAHHQPSTTKRSTPGSLAVLHLAVVALRRKLFLGHIHFYSPMRSSNRLPCRHRTA